MSSVAAQMMPTAKGSRAVRAFRGRRRLQATQRRPARTPVSPESIGGVLTNATKAAKRWYHRPPPAARSARLLFVSAHLLHLAAMGLIVLSGDWAWTLANSALLLTGALAVEFTPVQLKRPLSMAVFMTAALTNLFWLQVPTALAWFAPLFFLKLLVCHLVLEAPLERWRNHA
ncbi:hypothetical protein ACF1G0_32445 [Streptomyces sp. NPDC013953]|uniref:hypothetical protein n=1 Tax=Streptomyces sp. NPDC013953 TaxID=3364868 RepID=UPI0036F8C0BA